MPGQLSRAAAIVGAAEADWIGYPETPKTAMQLHISAIKNVSKQTGIPISAIDGIFSAGASSAIAEHLASTPPTSTPPHGGCSFEMHVHHALAAIHAGIVNVALVTHGENGWSSRATKGAGTGRAAAWTHGTRAASSAIPTAFPAPPRTTPTR